MPNESSKAGHKPVRTCVICRRRDEKSKMIRFIVSEGNIVIDYKQKLNLRGYYCCNQNLCINLLDKWLKKRSKKNKIT